MGLILNRLYLVHVQKELCKVLVAHLLFSAIQCTIMNARIMCTFLPSTLLQIVLLKLLHIIFAYHCYIHHIIIASIVNDILSVLAGILPLSQIYLTYPLGVHGPLVQNCCLRKYLHHAKQITWASYYWDFVPQVFQVTRVLDLLYFLWVQ
jgi:hypothetical protein